MATKQRVAAPGSAASSARRLLLGQLQQRRLAAEQRVVRGRRLDAGTGDDPRQQRPNEERHPQDRRIGEQVDQERPDRFRPVRTAQVEQDDRRLARRSWPVEVAGSGAPSSRTNLLHQLRDVLGRGLRHDAVAEIEDMRPARARRRELPRRLRSSAAPPATSASGSRLPCSATLRRHQRARPAPGRRRCPVPTASTPGRRRIFADARRRGAGKPMTGTAGMPLRAARPRSARSAR